MKDQTDTRFTYQRMGHTETTCDSCGEPIAESEERRLVGDEILCFKCASSME